MAPTITEDVGAQTLFALVQSTGTWNVATAAMGQGAHTIVASVTDPAGNTSTATEQLIIETLATVAPAPVAPAPIAPAPIAPAPFVPAPIAPAPASPTLPVAAPKPTPPKSAPLHRCPSRSA